MMKEMRDGLEMSKDGAVMDNVVVNGKNERSMRRKWLNGREGSMTR